MMETPSNREPILDVSPEDVEQAIDIIRQTRLATVTCLQRRLRIGYVRAARIMDELESRGIIGPVRGTEPRQIFLATLEGGSGI
jgi:S-DNA-T family DNA segregation ATPase FtsK/SpoIIIE